MTKEAGRVRGSSRCRLFGRSLPRDRFERAGHCRIVILNEVKDPAYVPRITQTSLCDHQTMGEVPRLRSG
jgi:hypothetical protein